jgi:poly(3-hydroxybutyrate) depolymerase
MVHLLACDPEVSTKLAAYAIVAGGFGTKAVSPIWADCKPSRLPAPILEIHGEEDKILPYLLNDWEPAKSRMAVPHWLEDWSERNGCGEAISDPIEGMDGTGTPVTVTKLEGGGWSSEAEAYGGGILRTAKSCPMLGETKAAEDKKDVKEPTEPEEEKKLGEEKEAKTTEQPADDQVIKDEETLKTDPAHFTLLHYRIRDFGHGWPLQQIKGRKGSKEERMFDTTDLVVDWFNIHKLPEPEPAPEAGEDEKASEEEMLDDVDEVAEEEDVLEPIDIDAAPAEEIKSEESKASTKRVKQTLEEDHDEL